MRADFSKMLCENEIKSTEMALATESISNELQSMVEKLTNIKTKDLAELVKKLKYDGDIEAGESFNQSMSEKLDSAIASLTEIKGDIDNEVVKLFNGESLGDDDEMTDDGSQFDVDSLDDSDMASDFGGDEGDEEFPEFNPDEEFEDLEDLGDEPREEK